MISDPSALLRRLFDHAVAAADPMRSLAAQLPPKPAGRVVVVGAGKASARMAEAVEAAWGRCDGLVITRYGHAMAVPVPATGGNPSVRLAAAGRLSFAHSDWAGYSVFEEAFTLGHAAGLSSVNAASG